MHEQPLPGDRHCAGAPAKDFQQFPSNVPVTLTPSPVDLILVVEEQMQERQN